MTGMTGVTGMTGMIWMNGMNGMIRMRTGYFASCEVVSCELQVAS